MLDLSSPSGQTFLTTVKGSPFTTNLQNPNSSATVTTCKQALTSTVVESAIKLFRTHLVNE
ncbi:hypothetical protein E1A91_D04G097700v1 [Gossypium mustelinum]|uniref:Uncharacterized protein n=1 Tax=Gossypium mustelinum TaxID=34275 RepID=A0A5D2VC16_GOSMU|nr:hypothetical protein E1A91_D04G097700v1 [Gossypium mustelinum]